VPEVTELLRERNSGKGRCNIATPHTKARNGDRYQPFDFDPKTVHPP
jgi:hypothetical protein